MSCHSTGRQEARGDAESQAGLWTLGSGAKESIDCKATLAISSMNDDECICIKGVGKSGAFDSVSHRRASVAPVGQQLTRLSTRLS